MSFAQLPAGTLFAGDYRIVQPLSEGGMGAVYVAEQLSTGKPRALKVMHPQLVSDARLRERFVQEARVGARLDTDHVVEVVGAGVDAATGMPWLAMELLKGETLDALIRRAGPLPANAVREIFLQLLHALGAAHRAGVVHRDLKPENLFLEVPRREGVVFTLKVLDFGIAKLVSDAAQQTQHTAAIGTPLWMAPEQTESRGLVTPATDVWALGLIAYFLLTGRYYWNEANVDGASAMQMLREICMDPIEAPSARAARSGRPIPGGFDAWFLRCVAREPNARFRDAMSAREGLDAAFAGAPSTPGPANPPPYTAPNPYAPARTSAPIVAATAMMPPTPIYAMAEPVRVRQGAPAGMVAIVAVIAGLVVLGAVAGFVFTRQRAVAPPTPNETRAEPDEAAHPATLAPVVSPPPVAPDVVPSSSLLAAVPASTSVAPMKMPSPSPVAVATTKPSPIATTETGAMPANPASTPCKTLEDCMGTKPTPATETREFDKEGARSSLSSIAYKDCPGSGVGTAIVAFGNSGAAIGVSVSGELAGNTCIAERFRTAHVPPFDGSPKAVSWKVSL